MSEFELSTLGMLAILLAGLVAYSYWPILRARQRQKQSGAIDVSLPARHQSVVRVPQVSDEPVLAVDQSVHGVDVLSTTNDETNQKTASVEHAVIDTPNHDVVDDMPLEQLQLIDIDVPIDSSEAMPDVQFFSRKDDSEHAALMVFEPLIRFLGWFDSVRPQRIQSIDAVLDLTLSQPKNSTDIERALDDFYLDTDLPLRIYGCRAGQEVGVWQILEPGALYKNLRLTLQLSNTKIYANELLIQAWFALAQKLSKRLAATIHVWPDDMKLTRDAQSLYVLANYLSEPFVVQLRKPSGLWSMHEVHQYMTQWGLSLNDKFGQYIACSDEGHVVYSVVNDLSNQNAAEFSRETLSTMHAHTLTFCLDLALVDESMLPVARLWQDMSQIAQGLQAQWCNSAGFLVDVSELLHDADIYVTDFYQHLRDVNLPAGSADICRLLR